MMAYDENDCSTQYTLSQVGSKRLAPFYQMQECDH